MTWTIRDRPAVGGTVLHEWRCPVHGLFAAEVPRDAVPDHVICGLHGCAELACWSPSAVSCRVRIAEVTRGRSEAPPTKHALTTRDLAEGMPMKEWKAKRSALRDERRRAKIKAVMG